jgi:hypothetical protein
MSFNLLIAIIIIIIIALLPLPLEARRNSFVFNLLNEKILLVLDAEWNIELKQQPDDFIL